MIERLLALLGIRRAAVAARPVGDTRIVTESVVLLPLVMAGGQQIQVFGLTREATLELAAEIGVAMRTYRVDLIERIEEGRN